MTLEPLESRGLTFLVLFVGALAVREVLLLSVREFRVLF